VHESKQATTELNAVCAVVGGILGQEIIKALSQKGAPANNVFLFDGTTSEGKVMHTGQYKFR
jgi:ubiquitin-like 1-activating enzyme E1 A